MKKARHVNTDDQFFHKATALELSWANKHVETHPEQVTQPPSFTSPTQLHIRSIQSREEGWRLQETGTEEGNIREMGQE